MGCLSIWPCRTLIATPLVDYHSNFLLFPLKLLVDLIEFILDGKAT